MEGREDIVRLVGVRAIRGLGVGDDEMASLLLVRWALRRLSLELGLMEMRDRRTLSDMNRRSGATQRRREGAKTYHNVLTETLFDFLTLTS